MPVFPVLSTHDVVAYKRIFGHTCNEMSRLIMPVPGSQDHLQCFLFHMAL